MIKSVIQCDVCARVIPSGDVIGLELSTFEPGTMNIIVHTGDDARECDNHVCGIQHLLDMMAKFADKTIGASSKAVTPEPVELTDALICCEEGGEKCGVAYCRHRVPHPENHECGAPACYKAYDSIDFKKPCCSVKGTTDFTLPPSPEVAG